MNFTGDFFQATVLATAKIIAAQFTSGDIENATKHLQFQLGELNASDGAAFIIAVQDFIAGKR